jgi:hypothetical protein
MTRKHFETVAAVIKSGVDTSAHYLTGNARKVALDAQWRIAADLGDAFQRENARFDFTRFMAACGFDNNGEPS